MIQTLLIANRGEIALRIMRTAKSLGIRTVAVFADPDAEAAHTEFADEAIAIGGSAPATSYLKIDAIIDAAKRAGADAIHPGYGFLSENATFATACAKNDIIFVGPSAEAIESMGDKAVAKQRMIDVGVPCIPGYQGTAQSDETLIEQAQAIGIPIMVKAAAGGGGRGMRLVEDFASLPAAINDARAEALSAFGDATLILEKAINGARHVEIQIFADAHGNIIHLGDRDCSLQRRHQKVIEEAPCPVMTPALREKMGSSAIRAAQAVSYCGAGTVEFLLGPDGDFYFLEMNTRLQVEHPVTECLTGLDLVALQIAVAEGRPLPVTQADLTFNGAAIEARLYAEDPSKDFLPAAGPVHLWHEATGPGLRHDSGIRTGDVISPFYDPMAAKIIAYGETREIARRRLIGALRETALLGPVTNQSFLIDVLQTDVFKSGAAVTDTIASLYPGGYRAPHFSPDDAIVAAAILFMRTKNTAQQLGPPQPAILQGWFSGHALATPYRLAAGDERFDVTIEQSGEDLIARCGDETVSVTARENDAASTTLYLDGKACTVIYCCHEYTLDIQINGVAFAVVDQLRADASSQAETSDGSVLAPMHGLLTKIVASESDRVTAGGRLAILEAMKMQHEILAPVTGVVAAISSSEGAQVAAGDLLFTIDPSEV